MDLGSFILLMLMTVTVIQFWRLRSVAEFAVIYAKQYCQKNGLQYLSLARTHTSFKAYKGRLDWHLSYQLEFSSDGETDYRGTIVCHGKHVVKVDMPAYRVLESTATNNIGF